MHGGGIPQHCALQSTHPRLRRYLSRKAYVQIKRNIQARPRLLMWLRTEMGTVGIEASSASDEHLR